MSIPVKALLMVRPAKFAFNPQTASTNSFQIPNDTDVNEAACREFDAAVIRLREAGFIIEVVQDDPAQPLPDSVFPNNWFSTHENGKLILYPMMSSNRRAERKAEVIAGLTERYGYSTIHNFTRREEQDIFLEGTGSIVFDHDQRVAFACISPRTNKELLLEICGELGYIPFVFLACDRNNQPIYHTNVMMAIGPDIAVCCFESVHDKEDQYGLRRFFQLSGKTVIEISLAQLESFAGNMLFITNPSGGRFVAVSATAWDSLSDKQKKDISAVASPIIASIPTIEKHGGGSIRCMLAELY